MSAADVGRHDQRAAETRWRKDSFVPKPAEPCLTGGAVAVARAPGARDPVRTQRLHGRERLSGPGLFSRDIAGRNWSFLHWPERLSGFTVQDVEHAALSGLQHGSS